MTRIDQNEEKIQVPVPVLLLLLLRLLLVVMLMHYTPLGKSNYQGTHGTTLTLLMTMERRSTSPKTTRIQGRRGTRVMSD